MAILIPLPYTMHNTQDIQQHLSAIAPISLDEMAAAYTLLDRRDAKYVFPISLLSALWPLLQADYRVVEIKNERLLPYATTYYDTADLQMQRWHQQAKLNRYKVRTRSYLHTQQAFLEVKYKTNKSRTLKYRIDDSSTPADKRHFMNDTIGIDIESLLPHHHNRFNRITLVHNSRPERLTIDLDMEFSANNMQWYPLQGIAVMEVKVDGKMPDSPLLQCLRKNQIYASSFSKFMMAMYLANMPAKFNRYKMLFRRVATMQQTNELLTH